MSVDYTTDRVPPDEWTIRPHEFALSNIIPLHCRCCGYVKDVFPHWSQARRDTAELDTTIRRKGKPRQL